MARFFVRLYRDLAPERKPEGIPDAWPAELYELAEGAPEPVEGGGLYFDSADYETYCQAHRAEYDAWRAKIELPGVKETAFDTIDARTSQLINEGFRYAEQQFSLSLASQSSYTSLYALRDTNVLTYPVRINTIDDKATCELQSAIAVEGFYQIMVGTYRAHLDSGTQLKDRVRLAQSIAEVAAIFDAR